MAKFIGFLSFFINFYVSWFLFFYHIAFARRIIGVFSRKVVKSSKTYRESTVKNRKAKENAAALSVETRHSEKGKGTMKAKAF
jgi:hypothetical protein